MDYIQVYENVSSASYTEQLSQNHALGAVIGKDERGNVCALLMVPLLAPFTLRHVAKFRVLGPRKAALAVHRYCAL